MRTVRWIAIVLGLWIVLSSFLGFGVQGYFWSDLLAGALVIAAGWTLTKESMWEGWVVAILGAWMVIAALIPALHGGVAIYWNNILVGVVVAALAMVPAGGAGREHPVG